MLRSIITATLKIALAELLSLKKGMCNFKDTFIDFLKM